MKGSTYEFSRSGDTVLVLHTCRSHPFQWTNDRLWCLEEKEMKDADIQLKGKKKKKRKKRRDARADPLPSPPLPPPALIDTNTESSEEPQPIDNVPAAEDVLADDQAPAVEEAPTVSVPIEQGPAEAHDDKASPRTHAVREESELIDNQKMDDNLTTKKAELTLGETPGAMQGQLCYRMLVSSSHLSQVSPVFHQMLKGPFSESVADEQGLYRVTASGWDPDALVIVLDIIHGHNRSVPRLLALEMLAKVAIIVDYYDCLEIVEIFAGIWVDAMAKSQPDSYGKDSMLWLLVSWVFRRQAIFEKVARLALRHSERLITVEDLPIPQSILRRINDERQNILAQVFSKLYELLDTLCHESECSYECSSMLLGSLVKELTKRGILKSQVDKSYNGHSIASAIDMVGSFPEPTWYSNSGYYSSYNQRHSCSISGKMRPILDKVENELSHRISKATLIHELYDQEGSKLG